MRKSFGLPGAMAGLLLGVSILVSACATAPTANEIIAQRAQARWDTLFSGDLNGAYQYFSPAYRSSVSSIQFQRRVLTQKVIWTGAEYIDSDCSDVSCKVKILLKFSVIGAVPGVPRFDSQQEVVENWVKSEGQWWFVPED